LRFALKPEILALLDLDRLEVVSGSFVDEIFARSFADILYRIPFKNREESAMIFVLIELKTNSYKFTVKQCIKYVFGVWENALTNVTQDANADGVTKAKKQKLRTFKFPMVLPIVLHSGEKPFTASLQLVDLVETIEGLEAYVPNMRIMLIDLADPQQESKPEDFNLAILFMTLRAVHSKDVVDKLMEIYQTLKPTMHLESSRQEWYDALCYAATSSPYLSRADFTNIKEKTKLEFEGVDNMSPTLL
jgi:hypothetical protein